ncbi:MAG: hypothetical protein AUF76_14975 [Acidobacteria bacterium 13_1_20CM_2_65_9]|nr:MAG: hypothetical protein AUF76_14975 [Acidobacteria bacterium 13_1_20CM_2_65_9]
MSSVNVPPISSVIGVSRTTATPTRAAYEVADRTYQPEGSREYEETSADTRSRCGSSSAMPSPIAPMISSKYPYARSSDSRRATYCLSAQTPTM